MASMYQPVRLAKDQPILRRRRSRRRSRLADLESLQRNFWKHFDLDKFARDWQAGMGKTSAG